VLCSLLFRLRNGMQLTKVNVALGFTSRALANDDVGALIASSRHRVNGPKTSTDIPAALAPEREQPRSGAKVIPLLTPTATSTPAPESVFGTLGDDELMHLAASGSSGAQGVSAQDGSGRGVAACKRCRWLLRRAALVARTAASSMALRRECQRSCGASSRLPHRTGCSDRCS